MFKKIPGGSKVIVMNLECWIPPVGMGCHSATYEIAPTDIIKRSNKPSEQYWEAQPLPEDWEDRLDDERRERALRERQGLDNDYTDPQLDAIREREWRRRLYGVWFWNNGVPVYLTGLNYFYLNYWQLDIGLPYYRLIDLEYFYWWQRIVEDDQCYGGIEVCKRRNGKTSRAACMIYEKLSRTERGLGGMQSMNEAAAKNIFDMHLIPAFQQLPEFFVPVYDTSKGSTPKGELVFEQTSVKGKMAMFSMKKKQLKSKINYRDAKPKAYDGSRVTVLLLDESGKVEHDVIDRHLVVKKCCVDPKRTIIGKLLITSTVEELGIKFRFLDLWKWSDQTNREKDGQTKSGCYQFFVGADRSGGYDIYGNPYVEETRMAILAERAKLTGNSRDLFAEIRKEPLTIEEAFKVSNSDCHFNQLLLEDIHSTLVWAKDSHGEFGNFEWKDGIPFSEVEWRPAKDGRWFKRKDLEKPDSPFTKKGALIIPNHHIRFACATDPFQNSITEDSRNSKGAAHVKQRYSPNGVDSPLDKAYVCRYYARPKLVGLYHLDMQMMCMYFGTKILIENNKEGGIIKSFQDNGMEAFLLQLPGTKNFGISATEDNKALMINLLNDYFEKVAVADHQKLLHPQDVEQYIKFNVANTEKTDSAMSGGYTEIADFYMKTNLKKKSDVKLDVDDFFRRH